MARLNIVSQHDGSRAVSENGSLNSQTVAQDHVFRPDLKCPDLSERFASLQVSTERGKGTRPVQVPLSPKRSNSENTSSRSRAYRITGLSGLDCLPDLRRQWLDSTRRPNSRPSSASGSDLSLSGSVSPEVVQGLSATEANRRFQVEAQARWGSSRRKRHSMSGYPSKEQYWARKISKTETGMENLRKSHREAQRMAKRKGKMVEDNLDEGDDGEDEILYDGIFLVV
ncbi:hypothetical protein PMZ80_007412 [Knufia obscura]|uniref:Uncharacterized protein n=1 Tax=Knufia obscura TaxID=1635080 RepID=A0ABR0RIG4_9EURO|nr:hypothetical protein PMZ80_007412 [Knufia obscura]